MSAPSLTRWRKAIQYRWTCAGCGETKTCAVIKRRGRADLRICETCYTDGFWRAS